MTHPTPASSFPAVPHAKEPVLHQAVDETPRNCVRRDYTVGENSCDLIGYDAEGKKWCRMELRLDYPSFEAMETLIRKESEKMQPKVSRALLPAPLRLLP